MAEEQLNELVAKLTALLEKNADREIKINRVKVDGAKRTASWLISQQLNEVLQATTMGEALEEADYACAKLKTLGVIAEATAELDYANTGNPDEFDVRFNIRESRLITGGTGVTVGNNEGRAQLQLSLNNFAGVADQLSFSTSKTSTGTNLYDVALRLPLAGIPWTPFSLHLTKAVEDLAMSGCHADTLLAAAQLKHKTGYTEHTLRLESAWRHLRATKEVPLDLRELTGHSLKHSLLHDVTFTTSNEEGDGFTASLKTEFAGHQLGGDVHHLKNELWARFQHYLHPLTFAIAARVGHISHLSMPPNPNPFQLDQPLARQPHDAPFLADRFFLGGTLNVRGFRHQGIGPRLGSYAVGGSAYWAAAAHVFSPLPGRLRQHVGDALQLHAFANAGNVLSQAQLGNWRQHALNDVACSYGFGLRLRASFCHLELNYSLPFPWTNPSQHITSPGFSVGVSWEFL